MPLTSTKLSDLAGGVYGLGASVASTGVNAHRPVIRAAAAHQSGETWEDVLEYYMVCRYLSPRAWLPIPQSLCQNS